VVVAPFTAHRGETSPFKVLDALACARPVVVSDLASVRPLAASGGLVLVPPDDPAALADAVAALLADPVHRVAMGWRGRGFVEQHASWDRVAAMLAEALGRR
jgi:glycosyltransferase involved in cell wall biosynthesis